MIYIICGIVALITAFLCGMIGFIAMGEIREGKKDPLAKFSLFAGFGGSALIMGLYIWGAVLGGRGHEPAIQAILLMLAGIPYLVLFVGGVIMSFKFIKK